MRSPLLALLLLILPLVFSASSSRADDDDPLRAQADIGRGPYFVGQGFELRISVVAKRERPTIDLPSISNVSAWPISTDVKPISRSVIGSVGGEENQFLTRFRLVPRHSGTLQIPSIRVRAEKHSARTQPLRVEIEPVPAAGRPAAFLGGIGPFTLEAHGSASSVRVGQEFDLRITVSGPAAWGMTSPPELARYDRLPVALRIRSAPTETTEEPPARTFVYHLRPLRPGSAVLPPISIASFDPKLSRFITQATPAVPIRVVAVAAFNPATIGDDTSSARPGGSIDGQWTAWILSAIALASFYASLCLVRKRLRRRLAGESAARRYAATLAQSLESDSFPASAAADGSTAPAASADDPEGPDRRAARQVCDVLIRYLQLGAERPPGALTPDEACAGVRLVSRSAELGAKAGQLMASSDRVLYGQPTADLGAKELTTQARALFQALGQVKIS